MSNQRLHQKLDDLLTELERGSFRLSDEKVQFYRTMLETVLPLTQEEQSGSPVFFEELDERIVELFPVFLSALIRGSERTAESDLKAILDSIRYTRRWITENDPERIIMEKEKKVRTMERLVLLAQLQDHLDEIENQMNALGENQVRLDKEMDLAGEALMKMQKERADLKQEVALYRDSGLIVSQDFLQYIQVVNRFVRSGNLSRRNAMVLEKQRASYERLDTVLQQINLMAFGTPQLLGNVELQGLQNMFADFQKNLVQEAQQMEDIKNLSQKVTETIEHVGKKARQENLQNLQAGGNMLQAWEAMKKRQMEQQADSGEKQEIITDIGG